MRRSIIIERKGAWESGWGRERIALIKSSITQDRIDAFEAHLPNQAENVSWYNPIKIVLPSVTQIQTKKARGLSLSHFWPLLKHGSFFEAAETAAKSGKSLKTDHHMQIQPGLNFINILRTAFTHVDPECAKKQSSQQCHLALLGPTSVKAARKTLVKFNQFELVLIFETICTETKIIRWSCLSV